MRLEALRSSLDARTLDSQMASMRGIDVPSISPADLAGIKMPLNAILSALLKEFSQSQQLVNDSESVQFEHFVNFSIMSDAYGGEFNLTDVSTGNQEFGLDGIAVIANGVMIDDKDEIDELISRNKYLEVDFIFTQAKTAANFDGGDMLKTMIAVEDFFGPLQLLQGEKVQSRHALKNYLYDNAQYFRRGAPRLWIFYVTSGMWKADLNLTALIDQHREKLKGMGLFSEVRFHPVDAARLQSLYFRTKNAVRQQIVFERSVTLPAIKDVKEAHIGVLPITEYLKLIEDENGALRKQLFFDNMRDYMEDSDTNIEIQGTLLSDRRSEFPLRNNGVTIVARKLQRVGNLFDVEDYQIVNGCQTSHVIFNARGQTDASVVVPIKIIVTEEDDVVNKIIRGSNFSNQFDKSQLWATEPFHKDLEVFFESLDGDRKLYYERRKGQFSAAPGVEKVRVVTPVALLKSAASMFLERPHDVTKYYSKLEPEVGRTIFVHGHNPAAYQAAAYAAFRLESLFRNKALPAAYKPLRHHLLMAAKIASLPDKVDLFDKGLGKALEPFLGILSDPAAAAALFAKLSAVADAFKAQAGMDTYHQIAKQVSLRDQLRIAAKALHAPSS